MIDINDIWDDEEDFNSYARYMNPYDQVRFRRLAELSELEASQKELPDIDYGENWYAD
jgi:hypothetical protein